jgi:hypothetical protein
MVCPQRDNTSTEVDVGPMIDLVTTLFEEENVGEGDFSRPALSNLKIPKKLWAYCPKVSSHQVLLK